MADYHACFEDVTCRTCNEPFKRRINPRSGQTRKGVKLGKVRTYQTVNCSRKCSRVYDRHLKASPAKKVKEVDKKALGKKGRAAGLRFEKKVREDLEQNGWIVDKWTNNVSDFPQSNINLPEEEREDRKLIPAKPKFIFNPVTKQRQMIGNNSGFPDFIAFKNISCTLCSIRMPGCAATYQDVIAVESKMNGFLDKIEKEKCQWLLDKGIFDTILIASKGEKRGSVNYVEYV